MSETNSFISNDLFAACEAAGLHPDPSLEPTPERVARRGEALFIKTGVNPLLEQRAAQQETQTAAPEAPQLPPDTDSVWLGGTIHGIVLDGLAGRACKRIEFS